MNTIRFGSPQRRRRLRGLQVFGSLAALLSVSWAQAAIISVSTTCSLADAIHAANSDAPAGGCAAGSGADTIVIPPQSNIVLSSIVDSMPDAGFGDIPLGLPAIESTVTIQGNGSTVSRDPAAIDEFSIFGAIDSDFTLNKTIVSGGTSGVVSYYADVAVSKSTIKRSDGWGVYGAGGGNVALDECTVAGNGGGLFSRFTNFTVDRTAIVRNGYGIFNTGFTSITNSTVSHNLGDGMSQAEGFISLVHSTVTGNTGFGINNDGFYYVEVSHSIVAGNGEGEAVAFVDPYFTSVIADDYNIFGHSGSSGTNFPVGATDIVPAVSLASILELPLRRNGGRTANHALVAGSPAIDAIPLGEPCPATDQRNVTRPQGSGCDIGSYEFLP